MAFVANLSIELELTVDGKAQTVPAGNIKNLLLDHHTHGFTVTLDYWTICKREQSEDTFFEAFVSAAPMTAKLTIDRTFDIVGETAAPVVVEGLVTDKQLSERAFQAIAAGPVLHRHYHMTFQDRGQVLFRQHFPSALYVDKSVKALLNDHLPKGVSLSASGPAVEANHHVLSLGLGASSNQASYYDFLHWWCAREGYDLYCDAERSKYEIGAVKKELSGAEVALPSPDVAEVEVRFEESERATVHVLNAAADASTKRMAISNADAASGVRRDYLVVSDVGSVLDDRIAREKKRHVQPEPELVLHFARYPSVTMRPAQLMTLGEGFSDQVHGKGQTYRVRRVRLSACAESQQATDQDGEEQNKYRCEAFSELELKEDKRVRRPSFRVPLFPFYVEGKIVSEHGQKGEATYQAYPDDATGQDFFKVEIPLFKGQKVLAPYHPSALTGHFYLPSYRDARALVALCFDRPFIDRMLDFREGAKRPQDLQGETLQLGKKPSAGTSISHVYQDAKPVLEIGRLSGKDKQTITVSEGTIRISTRDT